MQVLLSSVLRISLFIKQSDQAHPTCPGEITDVTAPKYGTGEREKKLIEKMKSGERSKVFVHVTQVIG